MLTSFYRLARPALFVLPPEEAHETSLRLLEAGVCPRRPQDSGPELKQKIFGLEYPNPLGIAAGYDKDARVPDAILAMGFGFAEVGTLTPKPQLGNPKPRIFRLTNDGALINRLGFNNGGHEAARRRLEARLDNGGIVGVNIGANKDSLDRTEDYVHGIMRFNAVASYFMINVSSPNTPGLRDLQTPAALGALLDRVNQARERLCDGGAPRRPILVKLAPDLAEDDIMPLCSMLMRNGVDGIAISNTTLARDGLKDIASKEAGGLSGRPLFNKSTAMLARIYRGTNGAIPLIGVGGIDSGARALEKIEAGASLLQVYSGLVYQGPGLVGEIQATLMEGVRRAGAASIAALIGRKSEDWAGRPL